MKKDTFLNIRISSDLLKKIKQTAKSENRTLSNLVETVIQKYLEKEGGKTMHPHDKLKAYFEKNYDKDQHVLAIAITDTQGISKKFFCTDEYNFEKLFYQMYNEGAIDMERVYYLAKEEFKNKYPHITEDDDDYGDLLTEFEKKYISENAKDLIIEYHIGYYYVCNW